MRWLREFFVGLFTRHVGNKILALLLSLGLFGFVQASVSATKEIQRLRLDFVLAEELRIPPDPARPQYMLTTSQMIFAGLTISGQQSKIEPLAKTNTLSLLIDQRILNVYGRPDEYGIAIPITPELFRDEALFGKDVRVGLSDLNAKLVVNSVDTRTVRADVVPALQNVTYIDYEGKLAFTLNVKQVTIKGPRGAFESTDPRIVVTVPKIEDKIAKVQVPGESGTLKLAGVCEIQWEAGGIKPALKDYLRLTSEEFGNEAMTASRFQERLEVSCAVKKRKKELKLKNVPIEIVYPVQKELDLAKDYSALPPFSDSDLSNGYTPELAVRLPATLEGNKEFLSNLVIVLDAASAEEDLNDRIKVPYRLGLKNWRIPGHRESLLQVDLVTAGAEPVANFSKRQ